MKGANRDALVLSAIVISIIIHIVVMICAKSQVLARVVSVPRAPRHFEMQANKINQTPPPPTVEQLKAMAAIKDEPAAKPVDNESIGLSNSDMPTVVAVSPEPVVDEESFNPTKPPAFEVQTVKLSEVEARSAMPSVAVIETPSFKGDSLPAPVNINTKDQVVANIDALSFSSSIPKVPPINQPIRQVKDVAEEFSPTDEVLKAVDELVVEREKTAVRDLLNEEASELSKAVNVTMTSVQSGDSIYFKVMITPRANLRTVPKDVVVLLDASGSIGDDRLASIRSAAKRILRSAANTGDRFNLVAFRDKYAYAFNRWQICTQKGFDLAERWLDNQSSYGRTDVFGTISSVLTLPRDPKRPLIALVVTDGDANEGVSDTKEILSRFTVLNDGLISIYMYGVRNSGNTELIDTLTHCNRGESFIFKGMRWNAGGEMEKLTERFRDPVLSDLRIVFASSMSVEAYPRLLKNLYKGEIVEFYGKVPMGTKSVAFSLKGLNGEKSFEGYFELLLDNAPFEAGIVEQWKKECSIDLKLK